MAYIRCGGGKCLKGIDYQNPIRSYTGAGTTWTQTISKDGTILVVESGGFSFIRDVRLNGTVLSCNYSLTSPNGLETDIWVIDVKANDTLRIYTNNSSSQNFTTSVFYFL